MYIALGCLVLHFSCLDQIDLGKNITDQESIVIDARLVSSDSSYVEVLITRLFNFQANQSRPLETEAVYLRDADHNRLKIPAVGDGRYRCDIDSNSNFLIRMGGFYSIEIIAKDGTVYESDEDQLIDGPEGELEARLIQKPVANEAGTTDSIDFVAFEMKIPIRREIDGALNRFRFRFERVYKLTDNRDQLCYFFDPFQVADLVILDANILDNPDELTIPLVDEQAQLYFSEGYYLNVFQESVSEDIARYFTELQTLLIRNGNMFEPPVGKLRGNFRSSKESDEIFGFFQATRQRLYRKFIHPDFAGNPALRCPSPQAGFQNRDCENCIFFNNNTQLEKPSFWIE